MIDMQTSTPQVEMPPQNITLQKTSRLLVLDWPDGGSSQLSFDLLRRYCACAECRAHARLTGELPVATSDIVDVQLAGVSALQLTFADGHNRGRYPWRYLRDIGNMSTGSRLNDSQ